jgi:hypothetical protein
VSRNDEVRAKLHALVTTDQRLTKWEVEDNQGISLTYAREF